mgnify:CR=1 FL=1
MRRNWDEHEQNQHKPSGEPRDGFQKGLEAVAEFQSESDGSPDGPNPKDQQDGEAGILMYGYKVVPA